MKCPRCEDERLYVMKYGELYVDRCPSCRGIWLDTGELLELVQLCLPLLKQTVPPELTDVVDRMRRAKAP